jgi:hypothetical protein
VPLLPPEVPALAAVFLAALALLSLLSHRPGEEVAAAAGGEAVRNHLGLLGAHVSAFLVRLFGMAAFWPAGALLLYPFYRLTRLGKEVTALPAASGLALFVFSLLSLASLLFPGSMPFPWPAEASGGGALGDFLAGGITPLAGKVGSLLILPLLLLAGFLLCSGLSLGSLARLLPRFGGASGRPSQTEAAEGAEASAPRLVLRGRGVGPQEGSGGGRPGPAEAPVSEDPAGLGDMGGMGGRRGAAPLPAEERGPEEGHGAGRPEGAGPPQGEGLAAGADGAEGLLSIPRAPGRSRPRGAGLRGGPEGGEDREAAGAGLDAGPEAGGRGGRSCGREASGAPEGLRIRERAKTRGGAAPGAARGRYRLPGADLLDPPPAAGPGLISREELMANASMLETKLLEFGVEGRVMEVAGGPVITMYEYQPAPGVKIAKVSGLASDLAMAMKAESIRVVAPIPGKNAIGIELPNAERGLVTLRELVECPEFRELESPLTLVLGVDITGGPVVTDLGRMPHLLIAGATGSGKSVGLDCMIMSILYKAGPDKVRFLMIDPKCVELALYRDLPHLIHPVLTDPAEATTALKWAVCEMDARYRLMAENGVRNIQGYNELAARAAADGGADDADGPPEPLPYLVIIIDELSDLMLTSPKDVEVAIMRLCAKARASGIHLILATQRPSVDVLTGVIKANLPTRISFQVATKFDSRTILDQVGAENLLGKGDMLFQPPGTSRLRRLHGAYVSDEEKKRVTDHIRAWGPPDYIETLAPPESEDDCGPLEKDEKFQEAVELVRRTGRATISHIQRHLRIGYNRAARIIEDMEREGVIGPQDGARPRAIF